MSKQLFLVVALVCTVSFLSAQNVFDPSDSITTYNGSSPVGSVTNPGVPPNLVMSKWVRSQKVSWTTTNFKSYIWNGMQFRIRFPNNYNPANPGKYPVIIFFHGGGEIGNVYDNESQLIWGAQLFEQRINNGEWNGFLLFPQETSIGWNDYQFSRINSVLDTLQKYNNADPDRVIAMGLSAGGYGALAYASQYPKRVAVSLSSSPMQAASLTSTIGNWLHVPIWIANGGTDINPDPGSIQGFYTGVRNAGGNIYQTYFANSGHNTWTDMWTLKNSSGAYITDVYWANAHKAQPLVYFQNQQFCGGAPIAARMGITPGYYAYEWQQNGATIPGANGNEYTATQAGQYRVRFMRLAGGTWSAWSPNPVVISTKNCATDTLFTEHFSNDNTYNSTAAYSKSNFTCQNGIMTSGTDQFTQDATGVQGNRFLVNFTYSGSSCTYTAGDMVWSASNAIPVTPNTNYEYSFYTASQNATSPAQLAPTINGTPLISGSVSMTGTGNASWKKFTFAWNSGSATSANIGIINRTVATAGNDFAIDEICFKHLTASLYPACVINSAPANGATLSTQTTATLNWPSSATATTYDVYLWTGATAPLAPVANISGTSYNATGLKMGTLYNWYIAPRNTIGAATGCSTSATTFTTAGESGPLPACAVNLLPANGTVVATQASAALSWGAVANANAYDVYVWTGPGAPAAATAHVTTNSYQANGLAAGTSYSWYIVPGNARGSAKGCADHKATFSTPVSSDTGTGKGTGLKGDYYKNANLDGKIVFSRIDPVVNFNWGTGSPSPLIKPKSFSVRWTGFVQPMYSETYTFYTNADDGARLWVNGRLLGDSWKGHRFFKETSGRITLVAGVKYTIEMEYYEKKDNAIARLSWASASTPKQIIPQHQLFPPVAKEKDDDDKGIHPKPHLDFLDAVLNIKDGLVQTTGIYPNPIVSGQNTTLLINSDKDGTAMVQIISATGNGMISQQVTVRKGINRTQINTASLRAGLYIIYVSSNVNSPATLKLIIN